MQQFGIGVLDISSKRKQYPHGIVSVARRTKLLDGVEGRPRFFIVSLKGKGCSVPQHEDNVARPACFLDISQSLIVILFGIAVTIGQSKRR